jgi:hypothetical protein
MVQFEQADNITDEISRKFHASKLTKANKKRKKEMQNHTQNF